MDKDSVQWLSRLVHTIFATKTSARPLLTSLLFALAPFFLCGAGEQGSLRQQGTIPAAGRRQRMSKKIRGGGEKKKGEREEEKKRRGKGGRGREGGGREEEGERNHHLRAEQAGEKRHRCGAFLPAERNARGSSMREPDRRRVVAVRARGGGGQGGPAHARRDRWSV